MQPNKLEDGTLSRGRWILEDGTLSTRAEHPKGAGWRDADFASQLRAELQSLGGSKLESDGAYLTCKPADEDEAVRELARAGFDIGGDCGEVSAELFRVETIGERTTEQGIISLRFRSALEDEARAVFESFRDAMEAGAEPIHTVRLSRFRPEDGSSEQVEACERDEAQPTLFDHAHGPDPRGDCYEVEPEDLLGYSALGFGELRSVSCPETPERMARAMLSGSRFVFVPSDASGSDYGGSGSVGKSNLRDLLALAEEHKLEAGRDFWTLSGGHGSYGVAFRLGLRCAALVEALRALSDYPVVSDDTLSEVESEEESESWENCYRSDFARALESAHGLDLGAVEDGALFELFRSACDSSNSYWSHDSEGASIDLERVSEAVTREQALALPGAARDSDEVASETESLRLVALAREPMERLREIADSANSRAMLRMAEALSDGIEAVRVSLGSPTSSALGDCAGYLAQVARWPIDSEPKRAQFPQDTGDALEDCRAELASLRAQVGAVVREARRLLPSLDSERAKREEARGEYRPLPSETRPL